MGNDALPGTGWDQEQVEHAPRRRVCGNLCKPCGKITCRKLHEKTATWNQVSPGPDWALRQVSLYLLKCICQRRGLLRGDCGLAY